LPYPVIDNIIITELFCAKVQIFGEKLVHLQRKL
jgi:hypothetical protein